MQTLNVEIINPKAFPLLNNLMDLNLITIKPQKSFTQLLSKLRRNEATVPSFDEITEEVEIVRQLNYAKKTKNNH